MERMDLFYIRRQEFSTLVITTASVRRELVALLASSFLWQCCDSFIHFDFSGVIVDSFILLFSSVPLPGGRENAFGSSYSSPTSSRSTGKGKRGKGKGKGKYYKGKSGLSKSSKKLSKRSIDSSFRYRHMPVQVYDFYPIRPVYYVFPARPPDSTPLTPAPTGESKSPTATPSILSLTQAPSESKNPTGSPSILPSAFPEPSASPTMVPSIQPSQVPSQAPSISTCQWTVCGNPNSNECIGTILELSNTVRRGGDPNGLEIAVRCCSDTELPNFSQRGDTCPFAETEINGECYRSVVYQEAVSLCASIGARLCTKDELERRCTTGTGCGHNDHPVWSSTSGTAGYFDAGDNSFKIVTPSQDDTEIQETFSCRDGITADLGILTFDEDACSASCLFSIPYAEFENYCTDNPEGVFSFTIPGPFPPDTELYIGNVADSFDLQCEGQLSISAKESAALGCYGDAAERAMDGTEYFNSDTMTVQTCIDRCFAAGFNFAGLEIGSECFCDNDYMRYGKLDDSKCGNTCATDGLPCGGAWAVSVYPSGFEGYEDKYTPAPSASPLENLGCWQDDGATPIMTLVEIDPVYVGRCLDQCKMAGNTFAGLKGGNECYCGDTYQTIGTSENCDQDCIGLCGGETSLTVYDTAFSNAEGHWY